jgi:Flp pilus assembly protein protease CpaA
MTVKTPMPREDRRRYWMLALIAPAGLLPVALAARQAFPDDMALLGVLLALLAAGVSAITDFRHGKIFNWCTYPAVAWGLALSSVGAVAPGATTALGAVTPGECLLGLLGCLAVMFVLHDLTGGGMGDVKLGAAIGGLVGLSQGLAAILASFALAGVAVLAWCVVLWGPRTTALAFLKTFGRWFLPASIRPELRPVEVELLRRKVRLGPFFALGTGLAVLAPWHLF